MLLSILNFTFYLIFGPFVLFLGKLGYFGSQGEVNKMFSIIRIFFINDNLLLPCTLKWVNLHIFII